ncbi:hypothetical protein [Chitinophaga niabensis]|uniref:Uncharacterized protein n=1 Tax=Chitinophaga niabensis TaxID=536979 RepID=A0A1N6D5R8_9BACT|nr:hypothetical protein [Chitinophaga niabensis]SIN66180.1 hypothetical protein SAMN04488055_0324 [Chitinophaga niabensis]
MEKQNDKGTPKQEPWPEDDVAEKYIRDGGKKETPTAEEEEEAERVLREAKEPKK